MLIFTLIKLKKITIIFKFNFDLLQKKKKV